MAVWKQCIEWSPVSCKFAAAVPLSLAPAAAREIAKNAQQAACPEVPPPLTCCCPRDTSGYANPAIGVVGGCRGVTAAAAAGSSGGSSCMYPAIRQWQRGSTISCDSSSTKLMFR